MTKQNEQIQTHLIVLYSMASVNLMRTVLRNSLLHFLPAVVSHNLNVLKNLRLGYLEPEMRYVAQVLKVLSRSRSRLTMVDVGASLGLYTQVALDSGCRVIAIEPQAFLSNHLRRVFATKPVQIHEVALTEKGGEQVNLSVPFIRFLPSKMSSIDQFATLSNDNHLEGFKSLKNLAIKTSTLDSICHGQDGIVLIKIDVEGAEMGVLWGGVKILTKLRPILLIEIQSKHGGSFDAIETFLKKFGYVAYVYKDEKLHLCIEASISNSANFIFLPDKR